MNRRKKQYQRDEHHELGEKKEKENLKSKIEGWFGDRNDVGKELKILIDKWIPIGKKKAAAAESVVASSQALDDVEAEKRNARNKQHAYRPLLRMFDAVVDAVHHRKISHGVWRRAYNDGKLLQIGYLEKQGGKIKSWHRRLFLLREHGLYYFGERKNYVKGEPPRGYFMFKDVIPTKDLNVCQKLHLFMMIGKPHSFSLHSPQRTLVIAAKTHADMLRWTEAIEEAYTAYWRKYGIVPPNTEPSPSTEGKLMSIEETHELAEVLDALDLEFEQAEENLKKRIYMAKAFAAWKYAFEKKILAAKEDHE